MSIHNSIYKYYRLISEYNLCISSDGGKNILIHCPFHDDSKASFSINKYNGLFNCFSSECRGKGICGDVEKFEYLLKNKF